jgi:hypothetical protein
MTRKREVLAPSALFCVSLLLGGGGGGSQGGSPPPPPPPTIRFSSILVLCVLLGFGASLAGSAEDVPETAYEEKNLVVRFRYH